MTDRRLSRREFLKVSAGAMGAGLMAACAASPAPTGEEMAAEYGGDEAAQRLDAS